MINFNVVFTFITFVSYLTIIESIGADAKNPLSVWQLATDDRIHMTNHRGT